MILLAPILMPIVSYLKGNDNFTWDFIAIEIMTIFLLIFNLPSIYLLISYYLENKDTKIEIDKDSDKIVVTKSKIVNQYKISEIKSSVYHLGIYHHNPKDDFRSFWAPHSDLAYWDLKFNNGDRYYLSNLLVDFLHDEPIFENTKTQYRAFQYIDRIDVKQEAKKKISENNLRKFESKFEYKNNDELIHIVENKNDYQKEAVEAAKNLLRKKQG